MSRDGERIRLLGNNARDARGRRTKNCLIPGLINKFMVVGMLNIVVGYSAYMFLLPYCKENIDPNSTTTEAINSYEKCIGFSQSVAGMAMIFLNILACFIIYRMEVKARRNAFIRRSQRLDQLSQNVVPNPTYTIGSDPT